MKKSRVFFFRKIPTLVSSALLALMPVTALQLQGWGGESLEERDSVHVLDEDASGGTAHLDGGSSQSGSDASGSSADGSGEWEAVTDGGSGEEEEGPTEFELSVIDEMNLARTAPKNYADTYIAPRSSEFSAAYFNECLEEMRAMAPVGELVHARGLWKMARAHAESQGAAGEIGHDRVNGLTFSQDIRNYGSFTSAGENISYGSTTARDIVVRLLVDDGIESRGHRKNLLSKDFTSTGVGYAPHTVYRYECVIDYAGGWKDY